MSNVASIDFAIVVDAYNKRRAEGRSQSGVNIELELRVRKIGRDAFMSVVDYYKKTGITPVASHSINVYKPNTSTGESDIVIQTFYQSPERKTVEHVNKKTLSQMYPVINVSINISQESKIVAFVPPIGSKVRIKKRQSYTIDIWRVDLTIVKDTVLDAQLKAKKDAMFAMPFDTSDTDIVYSIEMEHVGNGDLTGESMRDAYDTITCLIKSSRQTYLDLIASLTGRRLGGPATFDDALKRPIGLTKSLYGTLYKSIGSMLISDKIDGMHTVCIFKEGQLILLNNISINIIKTRQEQSMPMIVLEAEIVNDHYYVMDMIAFGTSDITKLSYSERLMAIPTALSALKSIIPKPLVFIAKEFVKIETHDRLEALVGKFLDNKHRKYDIDGLIFATDLSYAAMTIYKWKPFDKNSIDFYTKRASKEIAGRPPYASMAAKHGSLDMYILFSGIAKDRMRALGLTFMDGYDDLIRGGLNDRYIHIQFSPAIHPLAYVYFHDSKKHGNVDGKVVELTMSDPKNLMWKFLKARDDKVVGNDFKTAELTYFNYVAPFTREDLYKPDLGYFNVAYGPEEKALYFMSNTLKRRAITRFLRDNVERYSSWLIDLAAGRGADLRTYIGLNIKNVIVFDIDPTAIFNLLNKRYKGGEEEEAVSDVPVIINKTKQFDRVRLPGVHVSKRRGAPNIKQGTTVHAVIANLSQPYAKTIEEIRKFNESNNINYIICNFAIHYFCGSVDGISNMMKLVSTVLGKGGSFIFSYMDGKRVFDLLNDKGFGESYEVVMNGRVKYRIERKYKSDVLTDANQKIGVKLPFSNDIVDEYLVNVDFIGSVGAMMGMKIIKTSNLGDLVDTSGASDDDIEYIRLHSVCMMTTG